VTGSLKVLRCLDRETQPTVYTTVFARDAGSPARTGSAQVEITVTDTNDNKPMFSQQEYLLNYRERFEGTIELPMVCMPSPYGNTVILSS